MISRLSIIKQIIENIKGMADTTVWTSLKHHLGQLGFTWNVHGQSLGKTGKTLGNASIFPSFVTATLLKGQTIENVCYITCPSFILANIVICKLMFSQEGNISCRHIMFLVYHTGNRQAHNNHMSLTIQPVPPDIVLLHFSNLH